MAPNLKKAPTCWGGLSVSAPGRFVIRGEAHARPVTPEPHARTQHLKGLFPRTRLPPASCGSENLDVLSLANPAWWRLHRQKRSSQDHPVKSVAAGISSRMGGELGRSFRCTARAADRLLRVILCLRGGDLFKGK